MSQIPRSMWLLLEVGKKITHLIIPPIICVYIMNMFMISYTAKNPTSFLTLPVKLQLFSN